PHAPRLRPGRQMGIWREHRLGGAPGRGDERAAARRVFPREDLRAPPHEGQLLPHLRRTALAPGPRASAPARRHARAPAAGSRVHPRVLVGGGPLYSTARDYLTFLQMLLHGGSFTGPRIL